MATFSIVCGMCEIEPKIVSDDDGKQQAVCSGCGSRDDIEDVQRIAGEHFLHQAMPGIQRGLGDAVRGNKTVKFTPERVPPRAFKWHAVAV